MSEDIAKTRNTPSYDKILYMLEIQEKDLREIKDSLKGNVTTRTLYTFFGIVLALWGSFGWIVYDNYEKDRKLMKIEIENEIIEKLKHPSSGYLNKFKISSPVSRFLIS